MDIVEAGLARFQILRARILPADLTGNAQRADVAKRNIDCAFQLATVEPSISDLGVAFTLPGRRLGIPPNGPPQRVAADDCTLWAPSAQNTCQIISRTNPP